MDTKNAVGYVRVSTPRQAESGYSLKAQEARIREWCKGDLTHLLCILADQGISGKQADNRPALQKALALALDKGAVVVVFKLDRLGRSLQDLFAILADIRQAGAELVSIADGLDTRLPDTMRFFDFAALFAEIERRAISERVQAAVDFKRERGERISRHIPYGYVLGEDGKSLIPSPREQDTIRRIREMRTTLGLSYRGIAARLNAENIPPKHAAAWSGEAVRKLCLNGKGKSHV